MKSNTTATNTLSPHYPSSADILPGAYELQLTLQKYLIPSPKLLTSSQNIYYPEAISPLIPSPERSLLFPFITYLGGKLLTFGVICAAPTPHQQTREISEPIPHQPLNFFQKQLTSPPSLHTQISLRLI